MKIKAERAKTLALHSLGIHRPHADLDDVLGTLHLFQIDSVNVFARAHLMPAFSRLGNYSLEEFEKKAFGAGSSPDYREYWAHCAALIAPDDWGLFEFRREEYRSKEKIKQLGPGHQLADWIRAELRANGPMTVSEFEHDSNKRKGSWWGWSEVKVILERLYFAGELVSAGRNNFSRLYAMPDQLELKHPTLSEREQKLQLLRKAAKTLGVATEGELADYFRFYITEARPYFKQLLAAGELVQVEVEGWDQPGFALPETIDVAPELSFERPLRLFNPFDPLVWHRERTRRLFNFDYQIEIYTPEAKRRYGYYTLPILYRDQLVGRVDLKHERKAGELRVLSLWREEWVSPELVREMEPHLTAELELAKTWIGAEKLIPPSKGNWAFGAG